MDLISNANLRTKEYVEENIPLLSIRKRTRAIQEETQIIDKGKNTITIQYEESQSVRNLWSYLKKELEPYIDERKKTHKYEEKQMEKSLT